MKNIKKLVSALMISGSAFLFPVMAMATETGDTMQEKLAYAGRNTILGVCTVFIMLIVISLIIYCFRFLPGATGGKKRAKQAEEQAKAEAEARAKEKASAAAAAPAATAAPVVDDLELIAVITAAIAAGEQVPVGSFVVRTIKRRA